MSELVLRGGVRARARVNIALIKYWGKAPGVGLWQQNLPAVPSLSLTLADLWTDTVVRFAPELDADQVHLDGAPLDPRGAARVGHVLDAVRQRADVASPFIVDSTNHVPTAAGLASSASGMAALAAAAARCAGIAAGDGAVISELARIGSGSASRSVFGGWVAWDGPVARPIAPADHWDLSLVIALVGTEKKAIGSREAMTRTARTSPFYGGWVSAAPALFEAGLSAVKSRDLAALISAMERSTMLMHACALGAAPPILYWRPASVAVMQAVEELREDGVLCGCTLDAGPNVKVLCARKDAQDVAARLTNIAGVRDTITTGPGGGVDVDVEESP